MEPFTLIAQNFWLIVVLVTSINFLAFKDKAKKYIKQDQALSVDYEKLFQHYFFWFNMPWIIMGIGLVTGGVSDVVYYFRPQDGNPFVLVWYVSIFSLWVVGTYWLIFKEGAEMLIKCPGALRGNVTSPLFIKILWIVLFVFTAIC